MTAACAGPLDVRLTGRVPELTSCNVCSMKGPDITTGHDTRSTHTVFNQVPPLVGHDTAADPALLEGLEREGAGWAERRDPRAGPAGRIRRGAGLGPARGAVPPRLHTHDRYGNRVDEVEYVPAYHELMATAVATGCTPLPGSTTAPGAHVARAAKFMVWNVDAGHGCPISMTYAVVPALRANPELAARFEPLLTNREYDPGLRDPATKRGLIAGMSMTEKQGGSDVRANTTHGDRRRPTAATRSSGTSGSPPRRCRTCS